MPQRQGGVHGPRWFHFSRYLFGERDRDGCNAGRLNHPLDQPHGLVAEPSGRRQNDDVHAIFLQSCGNTGSSVIGQRFKVLIQNVTHERKMAVIDRPDFIQRFELPGALKRENNVDVAIGIAVIIIVMRDNQLVRDRIRRNLPEGGIPTRIEHIKGGLFFQVYPACGDQRQLAFFDFPLKRCPGDTGSVDDPGLPGPVFHQLRVPGIQSGKQSVSDLFEADTTTLSFQRDRFCNLTKDMTNAR